MSDGQAPDLYNSSHPPSMLERLILISKIINQVDFTSLPTSQPTQDKQQKQKYSPQQVGIGQRHDDLGNEQQQQRTPQQPQEQQYAQTGLPELQHLPEPVDATQGGMFDPTVVGEHRTHVGSNKTHLFSRDDHHIAAAHPTNSPTAAVRRKRDVGIGLPPHHMLGFHPRPPAIIDDVSGVAQSRRASQRKEEEAEEEEEEEEEEDDDDERGRSLGHERDEEKEEAQINPIATSPLTIWKASVSEWSSCSTREGGQIGETSPEGIVTITPRFLQVGTNYFIGRSSWSSTECFQLQVTVRSSECGEGSLCSGKGICYANATMEHFQCKCCKSYMGSHCEEMNACISNPCLNNGICLDIQEGHDGDTFQCLCRFGYRGRYCEQQTNLCESYPCKNGGTCTGNHSTFTCHCPSGWSGTQCTEPVETTALATGGGSDDDLAGCAGSPCNNGICVESANKEIGCFCHPGFGGQHCEFEYNECVSNPCENGGTCVDHVGKFECLCGRGYTGERCQIKYDLCTPDPCAPSRVCVDKGNSYSCECLNGLSEDDCGPHIQVCNPNPCENGGTCWIVPQARLFYCSCRPGFTGGRCQGITLDTHDEAVPETVGAVGTVEPGPLDVHLPLNHMRNIYVAFATLASALLIFALVVGVCHCRVNRTYRKCFVKLPRPSKVLPSVRRPRPTSLFDKSRWERSGSLRLETDPDGAAMPMTCSNSDSDAVYYNVDVCDNQELPLIK
ncbi:delta and Notch-like epidermal growth factor-related receptor [Macrobrachium nipponense]|uniref:delta and Notch-like epidermal growth factor-related receptor n=1 Tax=Macrobrachium nipponense TaxID=159736 RepID=UPI0030C7DEE1